MIIFKYYSVIDYIYYLKKIIRIIGLGKEKDGPLFCMITIHKPEKCKINKQFERGFFEVKEIESGEIY